MTRGAFLACFCAAAASSLSEASGWAGAALGDGLDEAVELVREDGVGDGRVPAV